MSIRLKELRKTRRLLTARGVLADVYKLLQKRNNAEEIEFAQRYALIADDSDSHRTRMGLWLIIEL